jgi:hypothetical protein
MFCIVYGFSDAATHSWHTPSTWGFLTAGVALLAVFAWWQTRAPAPLLPLRIVLDRNRGAAYLSILIAGSGIFGIFLFVTYYLQLTLRFSPVVTGLAFLPMVGCIMVSANLATIVLMPRFGPRPLVTVGMLLAAAGLAWLTRIGIHSSYAADVLPALLIIGIGLGQTIAPSINTGTFGVAPSDAGVASASVNTGQQLGGSVGTALLNTIAASAVASYLASHTFHGLGPPGNLRALALVHGYTTAFWWSAAIFAFGAVVAGSLFRWGPLTRPASQPGAVPEDSHQAVTPPV